VTIDNLTPERQSDKYAQRPGTAKNDALAEKSWGIWLTVPQSQQSTYRGWPEIVYKRSGADVIA